jgi:hypothetical protein
MKKIILSIAAIALLAITIVSCGSKSSPKEVAVSFTKSLNSMDFEAAKKLGTPETGKMLDMLASFSSMMPDSLKEQAKNYKIEAKDEKIDGDKATVTVTNGEKGEEKLDLVKKDGKWLVNMSKEGMGAGEPAVAPVDGEVPVDEAMPTTEGKDSVKVETK